MLLMMHLVRVLSIYACQELPSEPRGLRLRGAAAAASGTVPVTAGWRQCKIA
jgi:hypothetical protein